MAEPIQTSRFTDTSVMPPQIDGAVDGYSKSTGNVQITTTELPILTSPGPGCVPVHQDLLLACNSPPPIIAPPPASVPARKPVARKPMPEFQAQRSVPNQQNIHQLPSEPYHSVQPAPLWSNAASQSIIGQAPPPATSYDYFARPVQPGPLFCPPQNLVSPVLSTPSTICSPVFSPASVGSPSSLTTVPSTPLPATIQFPRLGKPIVIPRVLNYLSNQSAIGLPFHRCYANVLADYGIFCDDFLYFLDELNILMAGHVAFNYTRQAGKVVRMAGQLDPTGITKLVGQGIVLSAELGQLAYTKGPLAKRQSVLRKSNETIFHPKGLHVSIMGGRKLRSTLGLDPKDPLTAPLMTGWTVPTKAQLQAGQRSQVRTLGRIIYHLRDHVEDLAHCGEANENFETEQLQGLSRKKAALSVRHWQVQSEIQHELFRGEALNLYAQAKAELDPKKKQKLGQRTANMDKEMTHVRSISWLVIRNLYPDPMSDVPLADEENENDLEEVTSPGFPPVSSPAPNNGPVVFEGV